MVNKQYQGKHDAGYDLCAHVTGKVCNGGQPGGTATLKDMSHDGQKAPAAPRVDGEMFVVVFEWCVMYGESSGEDGLCHSAAAALVSH